MNTTVNRSIICLIGSTKFKCEFEAITLQEGLKGKIVLSVVGFDHYDKLGLTEEEREIAHDLHFDKIRIANEIYVINKNGYIGESYCGF